MQSKLSLITKICTLLTLIGLAIFLPADLSPGQNFSQPVFFLAPPPLSFSNIQIKMLFSPQKNLRQDALELTGKALVTKLRPELIAEDWVFQAQPLILDNTGEQPGLLALFCLSFPPEEGYLCILEPGTKNYALSHVEKLLPIKKISPWPQTPPQAGSPDELASKTTPINQSSNPDIPAFSGIPIAVNEISDMDTFGNLFALWEEHQEKTGAFSAVERFTIWLWQRGKLSKVFSYNTSWELGFFHDDQWIIARQNATITAQGANLLVSGRQEYDYYCQDYHDLGGQNQEKLKSSSKTIEEAFKYHPAFSAYGLREGLWQPTSDSTPIPVLIQRDLTLDLEAPFYPEDKEYLIKEKSGANFVVPQSQVQPKAAEAE